MTARNHGIAKRIEILLVDDNPGDVRLTEEALKESGLRNHLNVLTGGADVLPFLRRQGQFVQAPRPDFILLDLNLSRKGGREVLKELKEDANLRRIPVAVLTISGAEEDILNSYDLHANCYIQKPLDMDRYIEVVKAVENFWFTIVTLPSQVIESAASSDGPSDRPQDGAESQNSMRR